MYDDERDDADRDVDVEHPAPGRLVDQEASDQRAEDAGGTEHRSEVALVPASFAGRDDVADDRESQRDQSTGTHALHASEYDQLKHALAEPGQGRPQQEDDDRDLKDRFSAVEIT